MKRVKKTLEILSKEMKVSEETVIEMALEVYKQKKKTKQDKNP